LDNLICPVKSLGIDFVAWLIAILAGADTDHVIVVISQGQIVYLYIKSGKLSTKSRKTRTFA